MLDSRHRQEVNPVKHDHGQHVRGRGAARLELRLAEAEAEAQVVCNKYDDIRTR